MDIICDRCGALAVDCNDQGYYLCEACLAFEENYRIDENDHDIDEDSSDDRATGDLDQLPGQ